MIIGEVVEVLISLRSTVKILSREEEAIIEACNLLAKLPRLEEASEYMPINK